MKILIVCRGPASWFIKDYASSLIKQNIKIEYFLIKGKGFSKYITNIFKLKKYLRNKKFDLIHAFYSLSAISAVFQKQLPVIVTFLGCDINLMYMRLFAKVFIFKRCKRLIFVSGLMKAKSKNPANGIIQPFGVNMDKFYPVDKYFALNQLGWDPDHKYILFASIFHRKVKHVELALAALSELDDPSIHLIEFKDIPDDKVNYYYNACDIFLLTSLREGSPQVIKEAMACNCPVVSTRVGDVIEVIGKTEGCFITSFNPEDVTDNIRKALNFGKRTSGRENIGYLEINAVAKKIINIYQEVLKEK